MLPIIYLENKKQKNRLVKQHSTRSQNQIIYDFIVHYMIIKIIMIYNLIGTQ